MTSWVELLHHIVKDINLKGQIGSERPFWEQTTELFLPLA